MGRKLIIDCDPGIDDAVALAMALFDPRLDLLAVTACGGTVDAERATQNVQALIELFDPPRHPRLGAGKDSEHAAFEGGAEMHGHDGLGNLGLQPVGRQHLLPSEKLLAEQIRNHPNEVTILCVGPLTGVASVFRRDPGLVQMVDRLVIVGGALRTSGDVTAAAEFNMHFDPFAAEEVLKSATTKTLVPLDVTSKLAFGIGFLEKLPAKHTRVGRVLQPMLHFLLRTFRQQRAAESIWLPAVVGLLAVTDPNLFDSEAISVEVETDGKLTRGMTIVDRRCFSTARSSMEALVDVDEETAMHCVINALKFADQTSDGM